MSSMSSVVSLSKYIIKLPKTKKTIGLIIITSIIAGILNFIINPNYDLTLIKYIYYGGIFGFVLFGLSAIITGIIENYGIKLFKGINVRIKHSMFISYLSVLVLIIFTTLGSIISLISNIDIFYNMLIFGCVLVFGLNTIIFKSATTLNYLKSAILGSVQSIMTTIMCLFLVYLNTGYSPGAFDLIPFLLKVIAGSAILLLAIYSFLYIVEAPMKKNLGIGVLDLISYFIEHIKSNSNSLEKLFEKMGEPIETMVSFISFKNDKGIKSLFISPCVHPGPLGQLGGSNMPTILANKFDNFTMVAHGPSTHDFNLVSNSEISKIEEAVRKGLSKIDYETKASKFKRYVAEKSKIGVQFFNKGMVILSTFAPYDSDDIEFSVGLSMMLQSKNTCNVRDSVIVDCHNSFTPESGKVLPGHSEVFELIDLIKDIEKSESYDNIRVGTYSNTMSTLTTKEGIGESGVKIMIVEVDNQRTAYVLFDSNNMEQGFRAEIEEKVKSLDIDEIEVMTTDTHFVNTLSKGYNPIGTSKRDEIIEYVKIGINEAINDLEYVEVGTGTETIKDLKAFGPNKATELISTISSIVAISKILAPLLFISAIILVYLCIFYGARLF